MRNIIHIIDRKIKIFKLKNHKKSYIKKLNIGIGNIFVIYRDIKKLIIGNNVLLKNYTSIILHNNAELIIGDNVCINNFSSIHCLEKIIIGENCLIGENVKLYDHDHKYTETPEFKVFTSDFVTAPIVIGKNCWLGSNVTVLKGVTIGDNCIIGAGCTIYKDIPSNSKIINKGNYIFLYKTH